MKLPMIQSSLQPPSSGLSKRLKALSKHWELYTNPQGVINQKTLKLTKEQSFKIESPALFRFLLPLITKFSSFAKGSFLPTAEKIPLLCLHEN